MTVIIAGALIDNVDLPPALTSQVDLGKTNFISNDRLKDVLSETNVTRAQVDTAVALNEEARLSALRIGT